MRKNLLIWIFAVLLLFQAVSAIPTNPYAGNPSTVAADWWFAKGNNTNGFVASMTNLSNMYVNNVSIGGTIVGSDFIHITNVSTNPGSFIQLNGTGLNPFGKNNCTGFAFRSNITNNTGNNAFIGYQNTTNIRQKWAFGIETIDGGNLCGANVTWCIKAGATTGYSASSGINFVRDQWYNLTFCQDATGANLTFFINQDVVATLNVSAANVCQNCNFTITVQGNAAGRNSYVDAKNFFSWSKINGSPQGLPPTAGPNLTITAADLYDASAINNFSVRIQGQGQDFTQSTLNGTILINNISQSNLYNLTFNSSANGGYFSITYQVNASGQAFSGQMYQSILYINATELISNNQLTAFGVSTPLQSNLSNSSGYAKLLLKAGTYNISGNKTGYFNTSQQVTISALSESSENLIFYSNVLRIDARSLISGASIINFTIRLGNGSYWGDYYVATNNTNTGNVSFNLIAGTYYLNFSSPTDAAANASITFTSSNIYPNYTFNVYTTNSINISIFDELIGRGDTTFSNKTVNIQLVSDIFAKNYSTSNGRFYADLITPSEYRLTLSTDGYRSRDYYFTLTNRSNNQIEGFLLSIGNGTEVTLTIKDNSGIAVENAFISLKRGYILTGNSYSYITVAMAKTDVEGKAVIDVDFNDAFYQIFVVKNSTSTTTSGSKIYATELIINMQLNPSQFETSDALQNVFGAVTFNNNTKTFSFAFNNILGTSVIGNLLVQKIGSTGASTICNSDQSSASATITCQINTTLNPGTYIAIGSVNPLTGSGNIAIDNLEIDEGFRNEAKNTLGRLGVLMTLIFSGTAAGLAAFQPAAAIMLYLVALGIMVFSGFTLINISVFVTFAIVGIAIVWRLKS